MDATYEEEVRFRVGETIFQLRDRGTVDSELVKKLKCADARTINEDAIPHYSRQGKFDKELARLEAILSKSD
jgi:hypothetical protein